MHVILMIKLSNKFSFQVVYLKKEKKNFYRNFRTVKPFMIEDRSLRGTKIGTKVSGNSEERTFRDKSIYSKNLWCSISAEADVGCDRSFLFLSMFKVLVHNTFEYYR